MHGGMHHQRPGECSGCNLFYEEQEFKTAGLEVVTKWSNEDAVECTKEFSHHYWSEQVPRSLELMMSDRDN